MPDHRLSAEGKAVRIGISTETVSDWIVDKTTPPHRVGRLWKFHAGEIDDWVRSDASVQRAPAGNDATTETCGRMSEG